MFAIIQLSCWVKRRSSKLLVEINPFREYILPTTKILKFSKRLILINTKLTSVTIMHENCVRFCSIIKKITEFIRLFAENRKEPTSPYGCQSVVKLFGKGLPLFLELQKDWMKNTSLLSRCLWIAMTGQASAVQVAYALF